MQAGCPYGFVNARLRIRKHVLEMERLCSAGLCRLESRRKFVSVESDTQRSRLCCAERGKDGGEPTSERLFHSL